MFRAGNDWDTFLENEFKSGYYRELREFLKAEYREHTVYPDMQDIFNAFKACAFSDVLVVIIGQDPYHNPNQAHGMCFSVLKGIDIPPSLVNIYKELNADLGCSIPSHGQLNEWAEQGVFLLNAVLSVRAGLPASHKGKGWETFTDNCIKALNKREKPLVFMLWGAFARSKKAYITNPSHLVLEASHPSPLSAYNGFFGCRHFSKANDFLVKNGAKPIDWQIK